MVEDHHESQANSSNTRTSLTMSYEATGNSASTVKASLTLGLFHFSATS